ncbi:pilus assembly protein TadG-related protein [Nocardioides sp. URHA0020]|uniref:pilus assembly protein TadG-related protein n=1 Tax=Nocardioides sp. URHA0020 TaxID=1380392 RepID=UPI00048EBE1E|nr:pilus assembly protein TadG-related protein [Nocardioides sp. URHA0020]
MSSRPERVRDERGIAAIVVTLFISALLFGLCAITVDVARWYAEAQRVQKAADAAASAGVIYMPQDIASATSTARNIAMRNGYPNSGTTSVTVKPGTQPSQLDVTVTSRVNNIFGRMFGLGTTTISRRAVSDYTGPQPMGSPCNTLGNEPAGGNTLSGPVASQLTVPADAICSTTPQFWMNVNGPNVTKGNGDQYAVRNCASSDVSGCTGTTNDEFDPMGYFYMVRIQPAAVNHAITLQLYDPAFVATDDFCKTAPTGTVTSDNWNDYATSDAKSRYFKTVTSPNSFCTGDNMSDAASGATITSFGLRQPSDSQNPRAATPQPGCTKQYPGYASDKVTATTLQQSSVDYNRALARVFHQWVTLCTFTPTEAGDYYLQVRTNVALGGAVPKTSTTGSYEPTGNLADFAMYRQTGDDTAVKGGGSNRFAVRGYGAGIPAGSLSVSALGKMSIYANATGASQTFNLIRLMPAAAGQTLVFKFFDIGDAASSGSLTVVPPTDAAVALTNCKGSGFKTQSLPTCSISIDSSWNGKSETVAVPIPSNYTCHYTGIGGCWFRLNVTFGGGASVNDTTTWTAYVSGDPVRLIE